MARKTKGESKPSMVSDFPQLWIPFLGQGGPWQPSWWATSSFQQRETSLAEPSIAGVSIVNSLADALVYFFKDGLPVDDSMNRHWFATIDALRIEDNEVSTMTRLSVNRPSEPRMPEVRENIYEDRNRKPFANKKKNAPNSSDLLLSYTFTLAYSIFDNIRLYQEFARNDLERLRSKKSDVKDK